MASKKETTNFSRGRRRFLVTAGVAGSAASLPLIASAATKSGEKSQGASGSVVAGKGTKDLLLTDAFVITMNPTRDVITNGYVWIRGDSIHKVGTMASLGETGGVERRSMADHVVMPGLINTHNHIFELRDACHAGLAGLPRRLCHVRGDAGAGR